MALISAAFAASTPHAGVPALSGKAHPGLRPAGENRKASPSRWTAVSPVHPKNSVRPENKELMGLAG